MNRADMPASGRGMPARPVISMLPMPLERFVDVLAQAESFSFIDHGPTRLYSGVDGEGNSFAAASNAMDGTCFVAVPVLASLKPYMDNPGRGCS